MNESDIEPPRRRDDIVLAELSTQFKDFTDRYERDWKDTQSWRKAQWDVVDEHTKLLNDIAPNYKRGVWIVSVVATGSIAYAVKAFLSHFVWK